MSILAIRHHRFSSAQDFEASMKYMIENVTWTVKYTGIKFREKPRVRIKI